MDITILDMSEIYNPFRWMMLEIDSGFEFMTFKPHDSSTRIKSAVAGHLPIYHGGVGLGKPIAIDYHVDYIGEDPFIPFMEAIKCNLHARFAYCFIQRRRVLYAPSMQSHKWLKL